MNDTFLKACRGEKTEYTPVWMMRQAGRFLPQYRKISEKAGFLKMCRSPELAAEVTVQPVSVLGVDAAIFFSDILTTVVPMGMHLDYHEGKGPSFSNPVRTKADVDRLTVPDPEDGLKFVYDAQRIIVKEMANTPLIGFAGSPLTVVAYMIEGFGAHAFTNVRTMMFGDSKTFHSLMDKVTRFTSAYLKGQAKAGSHALMLFDSFAGMIGPRDYMTFNVPYIQRIIADLKITGVPLIYFGLGQHGAYGVIKDFGADVIGVDYGIELDEAAALLGPKVSLQGNVEPYVLVQSREEIKTRVADVLARGKKARQHIFNLGHGVPMNTPVDNARAMVDAVHELSRRKR